MSTTVTEVAEVGRQVLDEIERAVIGKRDALELVLVAVLAGGHVLLEDVPGLAKTLTRGRSPRCSGSTFRRIQFTPDLMPADVTGSSVLGPEPALVRLPARPAVLQLLLADEINRTPPKTQAALLEAMAEQQVTIEGVDPTARSRRSSCWRPRTRSSTRAPIRCPKPSSTASCSALGIGYPDDRPRVGDAGSSTRPGDGRARPERVADRSTAARPCGPRSSGSRRRGVGRYLVAIVTATRERPAVEVGASPRGSLALLQACRARAALAGRDYVTPDDAKALAVPALAHRIVLRPEQWVRGVRAEAVVAECPGPGAG